VTSRDGEAPDAREDAAWQAIVEHFGDRAALSETELASTAPEPEPAIEMPAELAGSPWDDDHFEPPEAPAVRMPQGARLIAWLGLFGVPAIALICVMARFSLPSFLDLLLLIWFVGGFGYLVATMNTGRDHDGWDDGAVL